MALCLDHEAAEAETVEMYLMTTRQHIKSSCGSCTQYPPPSEELFKHLSSEDEASALATADNTSNSERPHSAKGHGPWLFSWESSMPFPLKTQCHKPTAVA